MNKPSQLRMMYKEYKNLIVYGLVGINIFGMIVAVRVYINYHTIQASISKVEEEKKLLVEKNRYTQNFQTQYLASEYATYFLAHENNGILPGEKMIRIEHKGVEQAQTPEASTRMLSEDSQDEKPQDAWRSYLEESLSKNSF